MKMGKNTEDLSLFERALEWYSSTNHTKREMAKELFPVKELEAAIDAYKSRKKNREKKNRENELNEKLDRCKKLFPVGTLIWNDDGTDKLPNVVVSEPYIGVSDYHRYYHSDYWIDFPDDRRTVLADIVRISMDGPLWTEGRLCAGLENILYDMELEDECVRENHIIDLEKFYKKEDEQRKERIEDCNDRIRRYEAEVERAKMEKEEFEKYDPRFINEEYIQNIVVEYNSSHKQQDF